MKKMNKILLNIITINKLCFLIVTLLLIKSTNAQAYKKNDSIKYKILKIDNNILFTRFYSEIAVSFLQKKKLDSAIIYVDKALYIIEESKNILQKVHILNLKSTIYRLSNNYVKSIQTLTEAYTIAKELKDEKIVCEIANNLGIMCRRIDDDANALKYHIEALEYARKIDDNINIAIALNSIGIIYTYEEKYNEALNSFEKAIELEKNNENDKGIVLNYNAIAWVFREKGEYEKAIEYYKQSMELSVKNKDISDIAICNRDISVAYQEINDNRKALIHLKKAYKIFNKLKDYRNLAYTQLNLGKLYYKINKNTLSLKWTILALNLAQKMKSKKLLLDCYEQMSKAYQKVSYYSLALQYMKKAYKLKDNINYVKNNEVIKELEIKYELKKNKESIKLLSEKNILNKKIITRQRIAGIFIIAFLVSLIILVYSILKNGRKIRKAKTLLEINNKEIQTHKEKIIIQKKLLEIQKKKLEISNASKDMFFSIIAHDLRNPFNALLSLSAIVVEEYDNLEEIEKKEMIELINESASNGYRLLENLLAWAKSQSKEMKVNCRIIPINEVMEDIISILQLKSMNKNIKINNKINTEIKIYADVNMIRTIMMNIISNALKFTEKNGYINIDAKENNENIIISIKDTGIGIRPDKIDKLFRIDTGYKRKGTEQETGSGLGLILVKEFMERHKGKIKVESVQGKGSTFKLLFPKKIKLDIK